MEEKVEQLLLHYLQGNLTLDKLHPQLEALTGKSILIQEVKEFWKRESRESFAKRLVEPAVVAWADIDDEQALHFLEQILENLNDFLFWERIASALEKRYNKPPGTLSKLIFSSKLTSIESYLEALKA